MTALFSTPKAPASPIIPSPVVMPTEDSQAVQQAQQEQLQAAASQSGRASTILTMNNNSIDKTDKLGG